MEKEPMEEQTVKQPAPTSRPNEHGQLNIDEFLRITDPNTQQVFVEQRA